MIGSCLVRALNDRGASNLLLVDDLRSGIKWKNLVGKQFVDLISKHALFDWLVGKQDQVAAIVHLGACSNTIETDVDYLLENNTRYSIRLAEWAITHNKRFLYASSAATYGDGTKGFQDDEATLEELRPINPYAFSKQLVDLWMKRTGALRHVVGLKYFNVFGPNEYHKGHMASMVLKMAQKAALGGTIQLYRSNEARFADGDQCRDFLYVKDAVKMTLLFLSPEGLHKTGIYNIGRGETTTWNALARALFQALKSPPRIEYIDLPDTLARQYQNYTCAHMAKFPFPIKTMPIEAAVQEYVNNYLSQDKRW